MTSADPAQGGLGIELWTMTEDILFDNIYVGHSIEDANAFKAETFDVKKPLEVAAKNKKAEVDDDEELTFGEDPIGFIRYKVLDFIDLARLDPVLAFKTSPETGAALGLAALTFFGMIAALFGLVGAQQKPVVTKVRVREGVSLSPTNPSSPSPRRRPTLLHPTTRTRRRPPRSPPQERRRRRSWVPRSVLASKNILGT